MIGTMTEHDGHWSLGIHLARLDDNETIGFRTEGLSARTIIDAISEMMVMSTGCRTQLPLLHVMASPSTSYSDADWALYWELLESEFGLHGHPFLEVQHLKFGKGGRTAKHGHRVYLRLDVNGRAIRTDFSAIRVQKVGRIAEILVGERLVSGKFNRSIVERLRAEGRHDVADAMVRAGLDDNQPTSAPSSSERAMTERLNDLAADEVWRRAAGAWQRSDTATAFRAALAESGLRLAMGSKVPVVVSPGGAVHPLLRAINKGGQRQNGAAIHKSDLTARLKGMDLPALADLEPVPRAEAGVFGITNLDRLPVYGETEKADIEVVTKDVAVPTPPIRLTPEQEKALHELDDALHSTASAQAKATRERIEAEVMIEARRRKQDTLKRRIEEERVSWELPGIGRSGWRERYKADLAGLPAKFGAHLKWVERLGAERRKVVIRSGATVMLEPDRTWTNDCSDHDIMALMIAHAQERGWASITITGDQQWREAVARAATRAGLVVADPDLMRQVDDEHMRIASERLAADWLRARRACLCAPPDARAEATRQLLAQVALIARQPEVLDHIADEKQLADLRGDLEAYERLKARRRLSSARTASGPGQGP